MTLIKSISGIRGTIGGKPGEGLSPVDVVKFTSAYTRWLKEYSGKKQVKVVLGRDARISGEMVENLVVGSLMGMGADVIKLGLSTTPTVEMAVTAENADGGIILTASHNPKQWNALKLLNAKGEFLNAQDGEKVLKYAENEDFVFNAVDAIGKIDAKSIYNDYHIDEILKLPLVDVGAIQKAGFRIAIDCVNSVGGIIIPKLLNRLGVRDVIQLYCEPSGLFPHNPEPLPEHLTELSSAVKEKKCDLGFVVDPDVDRLAVINEDGSMFGEEYTLVAVADYVLSQEKGNTASNLSSSRALKDIAQKYGVEYHAAAVGEVNVVAKMREIDAVIGGEGNGGVIYPALHAGRDALLGIALFLTHLAKKSLKCSELRKELPEYVISKNKIELTPEIDVDAILEQMKQKYKDQEVLTIDGVKIEFENEWVHLRKSNTEPIIRIYSESANAESANNLAEQIMDEIRSLT
jgi:phosphomannomutase